MHRTNILIAKPIIVGVCILEISKIRMYDFHYNFMMKIFDYNKCKMLYTDTDSFVYNIECDDIYTFIEENSDQFDTSDYPPNNKYGIQSLNKKIPGLMKDECNGKCISEFVGLRSKMYSIRVGGIDAIKKAKGVKYNIINKKIDFTKYLDCLMQLHKVYSIEQSKSVLDPNDEKRYISKNKIDTIAWGHSSLLDDN